MTKIEYFKNRGDEYGKQLAKGMELAERDSKFLAATVIELGADAECARGIESDTRKSSKRGLFYLIDDVNAEVYGYCSYLSDAEISGEDARQRWFLNHPSA